MTQPPLKPTGHSLIRVVGACIVITGRNLQHVRPLTYDTVHPHRIGALLFLMPDCVGSASAFGTVMTRRMHMQLDNFTRATV